MPSLPDPGDFPALAVSQAEITSAIRSFPAGSGGGSDGFRPQHLVDLLTCKESGLELASRLTDFVNLLLEGKCPECIRRILFGGNLIALRKKDGGIRPIAVGCYWCRLASKAANNRVMQSLAEYFSPLQLGVGVSGGCEAAVHAARRFLDNMQDDWVMVKLDFANAFNSAILVAIASMAPHLYRYYVDTAFQVLMCR